MCLRRRHWLITMLWIWFLLWNVFLFGGSGAVSAQGLLTPTRSAPSRSVAGQIESPPQRRQTQVPFRLLAGHGGPVIPVYINEKGPYQMLVDTGADGCWISDRIFQQFTPEELQQKELPKKSHVEWLGKTFRFGIYPEKFTVGEFTINNVILQVIPQASLNAIGDSMVTIDGILGANYLKHFAVEFNFKVNYLTLLFKGNLDISERSALGFSPISSERFTTVPLSPIPGTTGMVSVPVQIDGNSVPLVVDTGAYVTILPESAIPKSVSAGNEVRYSRGIDGDERLLQRLPLDVRLGDYSFGSQSVWQTSKPKKIQGISYGILGLDLLSQCHILIDFPQGVLYIASPLKSSDSERKPDKDR